MIRPDFHSGRRRGYPRRGGAEGRRLGAALVITLVLLAFLSVVLVGLFLSARLELQGAQAYLDAARARWLAQEASAVATAQISAAIGGRNYYVSQPGAIHRFNAEGESETIDLFTYSSGGDEINLNRKGGLGRFPVDSAGTELRLTWLYVLQDGTFRDVIPSYDPSNPVVGRCAYWVDDSSARVNLNTAWTRESANTQPLNHPSHVDLAAIAGIDAESALWLVEARERGWFVDSLEASRADTALIPALEAARFSLTTVNHGPEMWNCFGEPKIALTTRADRAAGLPYLDISTAAKTEETVSRIVNYLTRDNWPLAKGNSFLAKYDASHPERAPQLAYNIIDYVRSKEAGSAIVIPTRTLAPAVQFMGLTRCPLVTEIGVDVAAAPDAQGKIPFQVVVEVHLPKDYGLPEIRLTDLWLWWSLAPNAGGFRFVEARVSAAECSPGPVLTAGGYAVIRRSMPAFNSRPGTLTMRVALSTSNNANRFQLCPFAYDGDLGAAGNPSLLVYPVSPGDAITRTFEVADPRVNQGVKDWVLRASGNTLGSRNSNYGVGAAGSSVLPPQDTDKDGKITDVSLVMPAPAGSTQNPHGAVESVAELGFIHTGIDGGSNAQGVPWRTLRLQPGKQGEGVVPDWALLDLFTAPPPAGAFPITPYAGSIGGRVNINAKILPFDQVQRKTPLLALWNGISGIDAEEVSGSVFNYLAASSSIGKLPGAFVLPGEVFETADIAAGGEHGERMAAQYIDQAAVKSNVFTILALAQSLQQTPKGTVIVRGECLTETVLERVTSYPAGEVRFRTVSFQELKQ